MDLEKSVYNFLNGISENSHVYFYGSTDKNSGFLSIVGVKPKK